MTSSDWRLRRSEASSSPAVTSFARRAAVAERIVPLAAANEVIIMTAERDREGS